MGRPGARAARLRASSATIPRCSCRRAQRATATVDRDSRARAGSGPPSSATRAETPAKTARETAPRRCRGISRRTSPGCANRCSRAMRPEHRRHFMMVLFAARHAAGITRRLVARRRSKRFAAPAHYPALMAALERAGVTDIAVFAAAARRAAALTAIEDESRASRALAQFQGALAMSRAPASRGSLTPEAASKLVVVAVGNRRQRARRLRRTGGRWLGRLADGDAPSPHEHSRRRRGRRVGRRGVRGAAGPMEEDALRVLAGPPSPTPRLVDWEGTRYRVDLPRAEAMRMTSALGASRARICPSAWRSLRIADALADRGLTREALRQQAQAIAQLCDAGLQLAAATKPRATRLAEPAGNHDGAAARRAGQETFEPRRASLRRCGCSPTTCSARGLMELAYAAALGPRDGISISAAEAAEPPRFRPARRDRRPGRRLAAADGWHRLARSAGGSSGRCSAWTSRSPSSR